MGWLRRRRSPAKPGGWFLVYHRAWTAAHPVAWEGGTGASGSFLAGDVWATGTPEWDERWFKAQGLRMPRRVKVVDKGVRPGQVRLAGTLLPGESAPR